MAILSLIHLSKTFGAINVLDDISIEIRSGEFFSILGPSGCGKTTLLRLIAGFERPTAGRILIDGSDVTGVIPQHRGVGMVFQNYALFPHMTVTENVAYGLRGRGLGKREISDRVTRILETVGLARLAERPVPLLSGGEQQRVAVARAIVVEPTVLLFDEPLSNLDVALRLQTREEIRSIQRSTQITTVYVTHDQGEAMSLSDRVGVLQRGGLEQVGSPRDVYERPSTLFVAQFLGGASLWRGTLDVSARQFVANGESFPVAELPPGAESGRVVIAIKPESLRVGEEKGAGGRGEVTATEYLGHTTTVDIRIAGQTLRGTVADGEIARTIRPGSRVGFSVDWARCTVFRET